MRLEIDIAEHHYNNIMALDSVSLGRVPYKGIIMYSINAIKHGKVLEQEPTTKNLGVDCIDRAELLKAIDTWDKFGCDADTKLVPYQDHYIPYIHYDDVIKCIKSMPSVTPQEPRWIPVSERMPEEDVDVLVTLEYGLIGIMQKKLADDDNGEPCYIWQDFEGEEHEVIAWMPLPKPYSEGEE